MTWWSSSLCMTRKLSAFPALKLSARPASVTLSALLHHPAPRRSQPHCITRARRRHFPTYSCSCQRPIRKTTAKTTGTSSCPASLQFPPYPFLQHYSQHIHSHHDLILLFLLDHLPLFLLHDPLGHYVLVFDHLYHLVSLGAQELQTREFVFPGAEAHLLVGIDPDRLNGIDRQSTGGTGALHRGIKDEAFHPKLVHLLQFEDHPFGDHLLLFQALDYFQARSPGNSQRAVY